MRHILLIAFLILANISLAQQVSFVVKKDSAIKSISAFNINHEIKHGDTLYKTQIKSSMRLFSEISDVKVVYYEITIPFKNGRKKYIIWQNSNLITPEIVRLLRKVKKGQEVCFTYISGEDGKGNAYFSPLCIVIM
ncbi:MAG: hypothetical protein ACLGGV_02605 [Bacteroidia bacterium]